ncbi:MAG: glycosyltransferase family 4 protein [Candidatus Omnitrophica bacterium]|nr:glycosyltransferase family 4 protein [Candidatus Omnitrophota bacterium]
MGILLVVFLGGLLSLLVGSWLIRKSKRFGLIDMPNERSSHFRPTPKGGGLGIVVGALAVVFGMHFFDFPLLYGKYLTITLGAVAISVIGLYSDRTHIPALIRIILQIVVAAAVVFALGILPSIDILGFNVNLSFLLPFFIVLWVVSLTNFYNFMDGIDGLTAIQAIAVGCFFVFFGFISKEVNLIPIGIAICAPTAGFLILNYPPAKIFMGDVGSYFLGFYIAFMAITHEQLLVPTVIVSGVFVFDTVITLIRRAIKGESWYKAHKSHFYQRAIGLGYSHGQVTGALSLVFVLLMVLACVYLRSATVLKIIVSFSAIAVLSALSLWVTFKEKEKKCY